MVWSFVEKTNFTAGPGQTPYTDDEKAQFIAAMQRAYDGSSVARTMFHNWIDAGKVIEIRKVAGALQSPNPLGSGIVEFDLNKLNNLTFIDTNGTVARADLFQVLIHELGHALAAKEDGTDGTRVLDYTKPDYKGDNVIYTNQIMAALGDPERLSYIAVDSGAVHKAVGFNYTNGASIDVAVTIHTGASYSPSGNFNSGVSGNTRDLLIGDHNANTLQSGDGNDFLVGNQGDDDLNGGAGQDTAVYFDLNPANYDIRRSNDGTFWLVDHLRGDATEGFDTLTNIEQIQFGGKTYQLAPGGLTFQTDIAFVIDTTGSMWDDIDAVEASASAIIDALFADGTIDARIGIVGFKDTTIGEPSSVILPFTEHNVFADRKAAALGALASISAFGGGDLPETADDGLFLALNGAMGEWRVGAGVKRIIMFTDAEVKDVGLRAQVDALASSIGAVIAGASSTSFAGGWVDTFMFVSSEAAFADGDPHADAPPTALGDYPATVDSRVGALQIFTILTGPGFGVDTSDLEDIASLTGGSFLTAPTPQDLVDAIFEIIETPVNTPPIIVSDGGGDFAIVEVAENSVVVTTVTAIDPDSGQVLSFHVAGGADSSLFSINASGALLFKNAPDFEAPSDANGDNIYEVTVEVRDGFGGTDTQDLSVAVYNIVFGTALSDKGIFGTNSKDRIDGLAGADKMYGLGGNDIYVVDNKGDKIIEAVDSGIDTVEASVAVKLAKNVENIILTGNAPINATGNNLDNVIKGNSGNNLLDGSKLGNDTFVFAENFGNDIIRNFVGNGAGLGDSIQFDDEIFANFEALIAATTDIGKSLVINAGPHGTITLDKVSDVSLLHAQDFTFV